MNIPNFGLTIPPPSNVNPFEQFTEKYSRVAIYYKYLSAQEKKNAQTSCENISWNRFLFVHSISNLGYPNAMQIPPNAMGNNDQATPPVPQTLQSPMANLMSITETLPPGSPRNGPSPPGPPPPRTASRGSQHSPNSSGKIISGGQNGGWGGGVGRRCGGGDQESISRLITRDFL